LIWSDPNAIAGKLPVIRLLIADDHPIVREGLKRIVAECPDMQVVAEASTGEEVLSITESNGIDVILLDISMPGPGFLEVMRTLRTSRSEQQILVLSVYPEDQYAVRALRAGAGGYLTKENSPQELAKAIRQVYRGGKYVTPSLAEKLAFELESDAHRQPHETLSDREYQVLCRLGSGDTVKDIAASLALSPKTVSTYRARILNKMNLKTTADLIRYAVEQGIAS
jgi:DNA-binding NarL/FixJ family response regulator